MPVKTYEMWCFTLHGDQAEAWRFAKHLGSIENKGYNTHTADGMLKTSNRNWVTYIALQAEAGEDLGGLHLQGYVQFKSGIDFPTAKKCFKFNDHQHRKSDRLSDLIGASNKGRPEVDTPVMGRGP
jgi:hypothetical protein